MELGLRNAQHACDRVKCPRPKEVTVIISTVCDKMLTKSRTHKGKCQLQWKRTFWSAISSSLLVVFQLMILFVIVLTWSSLQGGGKKMLKPCIFSQRINLLCHTWTRHWMSNTSSMHQHHQWHWGQGGTYPVGPW